MLSLNLNSEIQNIIVVRFIQVQFRGILFPGG